jgi:hypothetical protein
VLVITANVGSESITPLFLEIGRYQMYSGHAVAQVVEALSYKPGGRGLDSRWCHRHNLSGRTMALDFTQPLTKTSPRNISWG